MSTAAPRLDTRSAAEILAGLSAKRNGFLPGWSPQQGDSGEALLQVLARFAELVTDGLREAPDKLFIEFLDAMGISLLPPLAARVPLVFKLADDAPIDVPIPGGTEAAAMSPPPLPSSLLPGTDPQPAAAEPLIFATTEATSLARAKLAAVYSFVPAEDAYADHTSSVTSGFTFFNDLEQIAHHLYIGHDSLFDLPESADVSLQVGVSQLGRDVGSSETIRKRGPGPANGVGLEWEYLTEEGWLPFDPVVDQTHGLTVDGEVLLRKVCGAPLKKAPVNGRESFWIRARVVKPLPLPGSDVAESPLPMLDTIRARVAVRETGLDLDSAFSDGQRLDTTKDFLPFGPQPSVPSAFAFACDEVFKRPGSSIEVYMEFTAGSPSSVDLTWEYSVDEGAWGPLDVEDNTANLSTKPGAREPAMTFIAPDDWKKATVNGESHYWVRARISKGNYGGPAKYSLTEATDPATGKVTRTVAATNEPSPPSISKMSISYAIRTGPHVLGHCVALNTFAFQDFTEACRWGRQPFQPFQPVSDRLPTVYFGFDRPLPIGLVSLFAAGSGDFPSATAPRSSPFIWEYRSPEGWSELSVRDGTAGFRRMGMVQFIGPADLTTDAGPTGPVHWIRARRKIPAAAPEPLPVDGLYLNAAWATQRRSVRREVLGRSDASPRITLALQHQHVLPRERIEIQEWVGSGREWESLFKDVPEERLRLDTDARGRVTAVWVTWEGRPHLYSSAPHDRHYHLERSTGLVQFGDAVAGMIPPPGSVIAASYEYGGGPEGNVAAGAIGQLHSAVPYVESVLNPVPAGGGASAESLARVKLRGPQRLRNRDRAVSVSDYEWLALEASSEVALTRCLPETGPDGPGQPGWVTVVIAPWSDQRRPTPSPELLDRVRLALAERVPMTVGTGIRIVGSSYRPVSVSAEVVLADPTAAAEVEEELRKALDSFLHPLTGGAEGTGWRFGQTVHLSQVASVIERLPGIDHAVEIQLASEGVVFGDRVPVEPDRLPATGRHLLKLRVEA